MTPPKKTFSFWLIRFWLISLAFLCNAQSVLAMDICARALSKPHTIRKIPIQIRNGTETSILLYEGPPITLTQVIVKIVSRPLYDDAPYRDSELPTIQIYYNKDAQIGAIVSRTGELHSILDDLIVRPVGGHVLGGVRWFPNPTLAAEGTRRLPSKTFATAPSFEMEERFFDVVVLP